MYINDGHIAGIIPLTPRGTNSTLFTECCETAITSDEANCPICGTKVIGWDEPMHIRVKTRWNNATRTWKR